MSKAKRDPLARQPGETQMEWTMRRARMKAEARNKEDPLVTPEAKRHGDYQQDDVMHVETATRAPTYINRGGTPVERWRAAERLDERQLAVIAHCLTLWRLAGVSSRVTALYGERVPGGSCEDGNLREIDAREDLHRYQGHFPGLLQRYWSVFENVCRYDMPAGVAGADTGLDDNRANARALTIVCLVADVLNERERIA